jgi:hypothetical protein
MHRYHEGLDKHDNKAMASAFTEDGTVAVIDRGKQVSAATHDQIVTGGLMGGQAPPAAANGSPAGSGNAPAAGDNAGPPPVDAAGLWHFTEINSYFEFESPTRATHYAYWMDLHVHEESRSSTLGLPGHYEDIFVKRNGQWLFLSRKIIVDTK